MVLVLGRAGAGDVAGRLVVTVVMIALLSRFGVELFVLTPLVCMYTRIRTREVTQIMSDGMPMATGGGMAVLAMTGAQAGLGWFALAAAGLVLVGAVLLRLRSRRAARRG
ncbi:hypothetical protein GCM10027054_04170 [Isoptericola nanjingensis]